MKKFAVSIALACSAVSGMAGLIHQLAWVRRMVDTLGATADTFSAVAGAFFLGLALGGWASTWLSTSSPRRLWFGVAMAELTVGILAILVIYSPVLSAGLALSGLPDGVIRFGFSTLLIAPPAMAMGLIIPWLVRACASLGHPKAISIYALNTVGGILGILLAMVLLLPNYGTLATGFTSVGINFFLSIVALMISDSLREDIGKKRVDPDVAQFQQLPFRLALVAFASGFLVLGSEIVIQLQWTQVVINSHFSGSFVLLMVLIALSVSAFLVPRWLRVFGKNAFAALLVACLLACFAAAIQPLLFKVAFNGLQFPPLRVGLAKYFGSLVVPGFLSVIIPFIFAGLVFPTLLRLVEMRSLDGRQIGLALAWNGLGGWLGAEFAQGLVLPRLGLWGAVCLVGAGYAVLTLCIAKTPRFYVVGAASLIGCFGAWILFSNLPQVRPSKNEVLRAVDIGREGVVAVVEGDKNDWRILFNNTYTLGGSLASANQERQAHLPILLHGGASTVATLGVATGSTAAGAVCHPSVTRIDAIELSPLVQNYAARWFGPFNRNFSSDPRVHSIHADARWEMMRHPGEYDVVIGDLFLPWRSGEGRLFSQDHFEMVQRSLKPGGLYCQWLPMYQLTEEQFYAIARTFKEVFPDAFVIRGDLYARQPILGLVGGRSLPKIDWGAVDQAAGELRNSVKFSRMVQDPLARHVEGVAMMIVGPLDVEPNGPKISLANAWLEWNAGQNIVTGKAPWFVGVPLATLIRFLHQKGIDQIPPNLQEAYKAGQFFLTLEVAYESKAASFSELMSRRNQFMPSALLQDSMADWTHWPAQAK